ncbi:hypothetical protein [Christiangramia echinicola]|uniref:Polymer-forming protein n=1 Tax=Christiangramia echinicola TaxID=279359 RepID=A0A1H1MPD4_9FLAO|nr:hypothetical protein [Christiangramia echinicola]SDR88502.1 hypothetical protein SAMN04488552_1389 [Christiangramia echinicola]
MKTKFLSLALIGALAFTSCQSDINSENPQEVNDIQESLKEKKHDVNKWHDEPFFIDGGLKLHEPGFFQGALANCDTYAHYEGGKNLTVLQNSPQSYHGEVDVTSIAVNDQLNICGTLSVNKNVVVNYGGIFNLGGEMIAEGDVKVNHNGHLVIEGNVVIKRDLVLNDGALVRFLGTESAIEVLGKTKINKNVTFEGEFNDVSNKIK